jgi:hypothetical protein
MPAPCGSEEGVWRFDSARCQTWLDRFCSNSPGHLRVRFPDPLSPFLLWEFQSIWSGGHNGVRMGGHNGVRVGGHNGVRVGGQNGVRMGGHNGLRAGTREAAQLERDPIKDYMFGKSCLKSGIGTHLRENTMFFFICRNPAAVRRFVRYRSTFYPSSQCIALLRLVSSLRIMNQ